MTEIIINKTIEELESETREHIVYDIRKKEDYEKETYPGAKNLYWEEFDSHIQEIPKDIPIYLICYTGGKSKDIAETLAEQGYEIYSVEGGYRSYLRVKLKRMMERADRAEGTEAGHEKAQQAEAGQEKTKHTEAEQEKAQQTEAGQTELKQNEIQQIANTNSVKKKENEIDWDALTPEEYCKHVERSIVKKFRKDIWRKFTQAINEYDMIQDGDKIAVCISGGKDSMLMAKLFQELERHGRKNFDVVFLVMNPGYNEINYETILNNAKRLQVPITVFESDIFNIVAEEGDSPCYLCARMRRGYLYSHAKELGCNKIALGHHYDDVIETILMGMLYGGQIQTMMPKLHSTNFEGMELIRPLYLIREDAIKHWRDYNHLNFIQCACRFTESCASCGGTEKGSKRAEIKELIRALAEHSPVIEKNIFRSVENVNLSTIIAYKEHGVKHHFLDSYQEIK